MKNNKRRPAAVAVLCASAALALVLIINQVAFADSTGSVMPIADGSYTQWTPKSGSTHYTMVDESSCNGTTDYNETATVGNRDSYNISLTSIPNGSTITAISIIPCASRKSNGGGSSVMNVFYRWNGVDSSDMGSYALTGTTPVGLSSVSWNGLSNAKNGSSTLEIGAVLTSGNKGARLGRIASVITYTLPIVLPADPSNLTGFATTSTPPRAFLIWNDNSNNETGFSIESGLTTSTFAEIATTTVNQNYFSAPFVTGTINYYRVRAFNAAGNSGYSNTVSVFSP